MVDSTTTSTAGPAPAAPANPGDFVYNPAGANGGGIATATMPGSGQSYGSPVIPYEFRKNAGVNVPGIGYAYQEGTGLTAAEMEHQLHPGTPLTLQTALASALTNAETDQPGTQDLQERLIRAGYLNPKSRYFSPGTMASGDTTYKALATVFNDAIVTGIDYNQLLNQKATDPKNTRGLTYWDQYQKLGKPVERTTSTSSTSLSTPGDARTAAQDTYQKLLGRAATTKEVTALHAALNAYERSHPTNTTRDTVYDPQLGATDKSVTQSGGVGSGDVQGIAEAQVQHNDGTELAGVQSNRLVQKFEEMLGSAR